MTQQHPITPPPELVQQWDCEWREQQNAPVIGWSANLLAYVAARAAQWGADQELEACCEWLHWQNLATHPELIPSLRAARRPKAPSLKEQALEMLENAWEGGHVNNNAAQTIRRALEALND
jgi:hypothetical protein